MKKFSVMLLLVFSVSMLLLGCTNKEEKADLGLEKAQKIEVSSVIDPESIIKVLDNKEEINDFTDALDIDQWTIAELPSNLNEANIYTMFQADTIKAGESNTDANELKEIATITTYKDSSYITLNTKKLKISYEVPENVSEYLSITE